MTDKLDASKPVGQLAPSEDDFAFGTMGPHHPDKIGVRLVWPVMSCKAYEANASRMPSNELVQRQIGCLPN